jgi:hypothetical protein
VRKENYEVYGADKTWLELNREGIGAARCTGEHLIRDLGTQGHAAAARSAPPCRASAGSRPLTCWDGASTPWRRTAAGWPASPMGGLARDRLRRFPRRYLLPRHRGLERRHSRARHAGRAMAARPGRSAGEPRLTAHTRPSGPGQGTCVTWPPRTGRGGLADRSHPAPFGIEMRAFRTEAADSRIGTHLVKAAAATIVGYRRRTPPGGARLMPTARRPHPAARRSRGPVGGSCLGRPAATAGARE